MEALVDANGNRTRWERDVQGRVTREVRADNTTDTHYTYDLSGPAEDGHRSEGSGDDAQLQRRRQPERHGIHERGARDAERLLHLRRLLHARRDDGGRHRDDDLHLQGAGHERRRASGDRRWPLSNDTIAYTYDQLGRVIRRTINGSANQVDWTFDALGRVTGEENLLGEFTYTYDGVTNRLDTVTYPNDQTSTYSYLDDENDHRLQTIHHKYPNAATLSKFDYTYDAVGNILTWRQQADTTAVMWKYGYDPADQLIAAVKHATDTPETVLTAVCLRVRSWRQPHGRADRRCGDAVGV